VRPQAATAGSGWKEYQTTVASAVFDCRSLRNAARLPEPIFTPKSKRPPAITTKHLVRTDGKSGREAAERVRAVSIQPIARLQTMRSRASSSPI
jgi:phosphoribosylaminoimidazole-succinocarboxamide synthase